MNCDVRPKLQAVEKSQRKIISGNNSESSSSDDSSDTIINNEEIHGESSLDHLFNEFEENYEKHCDSMKTD